MSDRPRETNDYLGNIGDQLWRISSSLERTLELLEQFAAPPVILPPVRVPPRPTTITS